MRKLTVVILIFIFCVILFLSSRKNETHKVLKIISSTEFYIDYNDNKVADTDELTILTNLENEPDCLNKIQIAELNYLGKKFANDVLMGKNIKVIDVLNKEREIILPDGKNYSNELVNNGYILQETNREKVDENLKYAKTLNLVSYNSYSKKYHKLDCKYAFKAHNFEIMPLKDVPKVSKPCSLCHVKPKVTKENKYPRDVYEKYMPVYKDSSVEFYVTDFTKYYYPSDKCLTTPCKSLLKEINDAKHTIDFAIYGVDSQPLITNALIDAQKRGVKIRWVYDTKSDGTTIYSETIKLKKVLKDSKRDIDIKMENTVGKTFRDSIMHNKFFVIDSQKVWTGSANISHTDLSGFNANSAILINSKPIAKLYEAEFEQMYYGRFHQLKNQTIPNKTTVGNSKISVYFSPQDKIITNYIIPLINNASKYIYVPVFVITHKDFNQALINAKNRGVDVKIIVDATAAGAKYSSVKFLRENKIPVKAENRPGKMHMKSIMIDDKYTIFGSMNFTKSGERYNDENVLIIENPALTKAFKEQFLHFWKEIPDKWLLKNPGAESFNSINSCFDGIDNDFDGKIDMQDEGCNYKLRKKVKALH